MSADDYTLHLGYFTFVITFLHTHRLLDDAGDHRVGKVQVFRSLRHFIYRSGKVRVRPADELHAGYEFRP